MNQYLLVMLFSTLSIAARIREVSKSQDLTDSQENEIQPFGMDYDSTVSPNPGNYITKEILNEDNDSKTNSPSTLETEIILSQNSSQNSNHLPIEAFQYNQTADGSKAESTTTDNDPQEQKTTEEDNGKESWEEDDTTTEDEEFTLFSSDEAETTTDSDNDEFEETTSWYFSDERSDEETTNSDEEYSPITYDDVEMQSTEESEIADKMFSSEEIGSEEETTDSFEIVSSEEPADSSEISENVAPVAPFNLPITINTNFQLCLSGFAKKPWCVNLTHNIDAENRKEKEESHVLHYLEDGETMEEGMHLESENGQCSLEMSGKGFPKIHTKNDDDEIGHKSSYTLRYKGGHLDVMRKGRLVRSSLLHTFPTVSMEKRSKLELTNDCFIQLTVGRKVYWSSHALRQGQELQPGQIMHSANGKYMCKMEDDCTFTVRKNYGSGKVVFEAGIRKRVKNQCSLIVTEFGVQIYDNFRQSAQLAALTAKKYFECPNDGKINLLFNKLKNPLRRIYF